MEAAFAPSLHPVNSRTSGQEIRSTKSNEHQARTVDNEKKVDGFKVKETAATKDEEDQLESSQDDFPEGGLQAWLCVLGAFFLLLASFGLMVSIGILQDYWREHQLKGYSASQIGWIGSVYTYLGLALGILVGPLFDRYGPRALTIVGSVLYIISIFALAECEKYWQFMLCLGVVGGSSVALLITSSVAAVSHWFNKYRGRATGAALVGNTIGGTFIPLLLRATLPRYGWAWSIRILGFALLLCVIIGNIFLKGRLTPSSKSAASSERMGIMSFSLFNDARFTFLTITIFGIEIVLFGALGILPTYASMQGYPPETGFYLISVLNGVSCLGRFIPGVLSDYSGRFNMLLLTITLTLVVMLTIWLPFGANSLAALYLFAALFGFGTGSWMALVPVCIGQLCRAEDFGKYWGTCYFFASLATLVCMPVGAKLVESVGPIPTVSFYCAVLFVSLISFVLSRWACLGWQWKWRVKI